jgi:hypothetical protein
VCKSLPQLVLLLNGPIEPIEPQSSQCLLAATEDWSVGSMDGALHPRRTAQRHERVATSVAAVEPQMAESWSEPDDELKPACWPATSPTRTALSVSKRYPTTGG